MTINSKKNLPLLHDFNQPEIGIRRSLKQPKKPLKGIHADEKKTAPYPTVNRKNDPQKFANEPN